MKKDLRDKILLIIIAVVFVFCERALFDILDGVAGSWNNNSYLVRNKLPFDIVSLYMPLVLSILYILLSNHTFFKKVVVLAIATIVLFIVIDFFDNELTTYCQNNNTKLCEIVYTRNNENYNYDRSNRK